MERVVPLNKPSVAMGLVAEMPIIDKAPRIDMGPHREKASSVKAKAKSKPDKIIASLARREKRLAEADEKLSKLQKDLTTAQTSSEADKIKDIEKLISETTKLRLGLVEKVENRKKQLKDIGHVA